MSLYQADIFDPKIEFLLEKTGRVLRVSEYSVRSDFINAVDSFSFRYFTENTTDLDNLLMQPVTFQVDGRPQVVGRIEADEVGDQGSSIACEGRDYIADLVECNIDPKFILKEGMTLLQAIVDICSPCGITGIAAPGARVDARTGMPGAGTQEMHRLTKKDIKDLKPVAGRGIYEVCAEILARFGLTLQPTLSRSSVAVQPPTYDKPAMGRLTRRLGDVSKNTIVSGSRRRDYSSLPTCAVLTAKQGVPVEKGGAKGVLSRWNLADGVSDFPEEVKRILADAVTVGRREPGISGQIPGGQLYRLLYLQDDKVSKTSEHVSHAMMRAIADRMRSTLSYRCTVRGHTNPATGYTWANDTIMDIDDDMARVHEPLWCHAVTFRGSKKEGPLTDLEFLRPWSYQVYSDV